MRLARTNSRLAIASMWTSATSALFTMLYVFTGAAEPAYRGRSIRIVMDLAGTTNVCICRLQTTLSSVT